MNRMSVVLLIHWLSLLLQSPLQWIKITLSMLFDRIGCLYQYLLWLLLLFVYNVTILHISVCLLLLVQTVQAEEVLWGAWLPVSSTDDSCNCCCSWYYLDVEIPVGENHRRVDRALAVFSGIKQWVGRLTDLAGLSVMWFLHGCSGGNPHSL